MSDETEEIKLKDLERMTVKDLRELAKDMPEIVGFSGMKKPELIAAIKKVKGIPDEPTKKTDASVGHLCLEMTKGLVNPTVIFLLRPFPIRFLLMRPS